MPGEKRVFALGDPGIHQSSREHFSKGMDCRAWASGSSAVLQTAMSGNDEVRKGRKATPLASLFSIAAFPIYRKRFMVPRALFIDEG
jgi:hypothetical protein